MATLTLKAHFDGKYVTIDEPHQLSPGAQLTVIVLPAVDEDERSDWSSAAALGLERAYSGDEPEYTLADLKP